MSSKSPRTSGDSDAIHSPSGLGLEFFESKGNKSVASEEHGCNDRELSNADESSSNNPFSDPKVAAHYTAVYEKSKYECRHIFDPTLEWSFKEEKKLIRRLDWHVCAWACMMFFALQVDRGNLSQALSDNLLKDLHLTTNDYNHGITIFQVCFIFAEIPSQLISKKIGPDRWIPTQITLWSIVAMSQAALSGKSSFYACRALLGLLEGGFIPDLILWLSYFYTSRELPIRLTFFWIVTSVTAVITSLLAFGILHLRGVQGLAGWRWLFLIEGLVTLSIGISAYFLMPASAVQTKTWFRPNGWFTEREEGIVVNRILRDDPSKGDMHNRQAITPRRLREALCDYDLWPIYALALLAFIPQSPPNIYLTLTLRELGFSSFNTNLLTIPPAITGIFAMLSVAYLSDKFNQRAVVAVLQSIWTLPCIIALRVWKGALIEPWPSYALMVVLLTYPYCQPILVGWTSTNSGSVRTRSISAAVYNICVQLGNIISANIYQTADGPLYHKGNTHLIIINILVIFLFAFTKGYYVLRNKYRDKKWSSMSAEEQEHYRETTTDQGNKRLDFRFVH